MPHIEVKPNGQMEFVSSSSKHKSKSDQKHKPDPRDQKIADLQARLDEVENQKAHLLLQYQNLQHAKRQAVEDAKAFKQAAVKYKEECDELKDRNGDLLERYERKADEVRQKDKIIKQKESEIKSKDKDIEDCRVDKKVQNGTIKQIEERNAVLQDRLTAVTDEKRRLQQDVAVRRINEEKLLTENKALKEEKAGLLDWVTRERQLALDREREARLRRDELPRRRAYNDY